MGGDGRKEAIVTGFRPTQLIILLPRFRVGKYSLVLNLWDLPAYG